MQAEYATDIVFKKQSDLEAIYDNLVRTAIHTVNPENIATFLGLIKNIRDTYKYYPTKLGRIVIANGLKLKELFIIPKLCY